MIFSDCSSSELRPTEVQRLIIGKMVPIFAINSVV
eukprot:COSAG01_NODE_591_length_15119_cov_19.340879_10_plen_35_part_00